MKRGDTRERALAKKKLTHKKESTNEAPPKKAKGTKPKPVFEPIVFVAGVSGRQKEKANTRADVKEPRRVYRSSQAIREPYHGEVEFYKRAFDKTFHEIPLVPSLIVESIPYASWARQRGIPQIVGEASFNTFPRMVCYRLASGAVENEPAFRLYGGTNVNICAEVQCATQNNRYRSDAELWQFFTRMDADKQTAGVPTCLNSLMNYFRDDQERMQRMCNLTREFLMWLRCDNFTLMINSEVQAAQDPNLYWLAGCTWGVSTYDAQNTFATPFKVALARGLREGKGIKSLMKSPTQLCRDVGGDTGEENVSGPAGVDAIIEHIKKKGGKAFQNVNLQARVPLYTGPDGHVVLTEGATLQEYVAD